MLAPHPEVYRLTAVATTIDVHVRAGAAAAERGVPRRTQRYGDVRRRSPLRAPRGPHRLRGPHRHAARRPLSALPTARRSSARSSATRARSGWWLPPATDVSLVRQPREAVGDRICSSSRRAGSTGGRGVAAGRVARAGQGDREGAPSTGSDLSSTFVVASGCIDERGRRPPRHRPARRPVPRRRTTSASRSYRGRWPTLMARSLR